MATGRKQVAPGQVIQSAEWGNAVWDQSTNTFATPADRDAQWPAPPQGATCWTEDTGTLWVRRATAWVRCQVGIEMATGSVTFASAVNTVQAIVVTLPAGRLSGVIGGISLHPNNSKPQEISLSYGAVTATGFTIYEHRTQSGTVGVSWLAVRVV